MSNKIMVLTSSERIFSRLKKNGIKATRVSTDASVSEILGLLPTDFLLVYIGSPLTNLSELDMRLQSKGITYTAFTGDKKSVHRDLQSLGIDSDSTDIIKGICEEFGL